ncbi:uncharacterized protein LOC111324361 [Stylophora pistillata]|uniref:Uncharacterized protein n=1 Tax=Stylophora pistillata TaxID=50429 RepID=A0A2B4SIW9_STYPI|nr:uncharacterized protein LOC111324361 [Stylophora pistillata]PFX29831.1 hypothetical protein AWC38_SpisGene5359 [Stylophora pistillata]
MCSGSKLSCVSSENAWRFPLSSGLLGFMLGMSTFGAAMKLSEYKESPSLPPLIAAIPMLSAGLTGMVGGRMRKRWLISLHMALCLVTGVFGLHLIFLFMGREVESRNIHKAKCQSNYQGSYYCHRYATTIALSGLSVLAITLAPLGILSYVVIRRISAYNVNEVLEANNPAFDAEPSPTKRTGEDQVDYQHQRVFDRAANHPPKAEPKSQTHRPVNLRNSHGGECPPPNHKEPFGSDRVATNSAMTQHKMQNYQILHYKKSDDDMRLSPNQKQPYSRDQVGIHQPSAQPKPQNHRPLQHENSHGDKRLPLNHKQSAGGNRAQNQSSKVDPRPPNHRALYHKNFRDNMRLPPSYKQPDDRNRVSIEPRKNESQPKNHRLPHNKYQHDDVRFAERDVNHIQPLGNRPSRDFMKYSRDRYRQQNMDQVSRAPTTRFGQSHVPLAGVKVAKGISNMTDTSFA